MILKGVNQMNEPKYSGVIGNIFGKPHPDSVVPDRPYMPIHLVTKEPENFLAEEQTEERVKFHRDPVEKNNPSFNKSKPLPENKPLESHTHTLRHLENKPGYC